MARKIINRPEQKIQKAVFDHLKARGVPKIFYFHPFNGGKRSAIEAAIYKSLGARPGLPDVMVIKNGMTYGLELKANKGKLTDIQTETIFLMSHAGACVSYAVGLDAALAKLEEWELLRPNASMPVLNSPTTGMVVTNKKS